MKGKALIYQPKTVAAELDIVRSSPHRDNYFVYHVLACKSSIRSALNRFFQQVYARKPRQPPALAGKSGLAA